MNGRQPSIIIIARHGARLDQADREWTAKSDRPWDAPLSYGGWTQAQNLGARIASELESLNILPILDNVRPDEQLPGPPRKRRKIIIHSSPFLRCVQTSIGIAAGMRYPQDIARQRPNLAHLQRPLQPPPTSAPSGPITPPSESNIYDLKRQPSISTPPTLKIDAFLGEWLSTGYYEKTGPPPESAVLVKDAKETLKKPREEIRGADLPIIADEANNNGEDKENSAKHYPLIERPSLIERPGMRAMAAALTGSLPKRSMTISFGKEISNESKPGMRSHRRARSSTYSPPIPTYSIAPQDPIPVGFVAHARDACLELDLDWDSEHAPLAWGNGGQYEEEWSIMHRRFLTGLQQMLGYYGMQAIQTEADDPDDEEDTVVILVTHQAGCNALIRLVTGAPALHDVGTASLTMAVRKPIVATRRQSIQDPTSPAHQDPQRRGSVDLGLADIYDLKFLAATEHLRSGSIAQGINSPRLGMNSPAFGSRRGTNSEAIEPISIDDNISWRRGSLPSTVRTSSLRSHAADSPSSNAVPMSPSTAAGLWGSRKPSRHDSIGTDGGIDPKSTITNVRSGTIHEEEEEWMPDGTGKDHSAAPVPLANGVTTRGSSMNWQVHASRIASDTTLRNGVSSLDLNSNSTNPTSNGAGAGLWGASRPKESRGLWGGGGNIDSVSGATSRSSFGEASLQARDRLSGGTGRRRWTALAAGE